MRVISLNANGIRAALKKGFFDWLPKQNADIVCLQEVRIQEPQLSEIMRHPGPLRAHYYLAKKPGYSGVAIYFKKKPLRISEGIGWDQADAEGRLLSVEYKNLTIASIYIPSGSSSENRQSFKYEFMRRLRQWMNKKILEKKEVLICGDWNIAHTKMDLKNWRGNKKNSGFLPEERAWMDKIFRNNKWQDIFRKLHPKTEGQGYTWWSNRGNAWANNTGWRIDYQIGTTEIAAKSDKARVYKKKRFSDHAPLCIDYSIRL